MELNIDIRLLPLHSKLHEEIIKILNEVKPPKISEKNFKKILNITTPMMCDSALKIIELQKFLRSIEMEITQ